MLSRGNDARCTNGKEIFISHSGANDLCRTNSSIIRETVIHTYFFIELCVIVLDVIVLVSAPNITYLL